MVTLISDGGQMTVGRRLASHVWGQFSVTLPEGEKQKDPDDDRIVDGYVYRPDDAGRGRGELTFMRADAKLDMNAGKSDLEATLDGASRRTEGDVFYSREISGLGLGRAVPGVDYTVGDVVSVLVWGRRLTLPVTAVTAVSDTNRGAPWRVQVGGQVLRDAAALRKRNDDLQAQIAVEKRQRLRQVGTVDRKATRAQGTADKAAEHASELKKFLAGSDGGDLVDALDAINKQLAAQEEPAASGLVPAYLRINAQLWEAQQLINDQQKLIDEAQNKAAAAQKAAVDAQASMLKMTREYMSGSFVAEADHSTWVGYLGVGVVMPSNNRWLRVYRTPGMKKNASVLVIYNNADSRLYSAHHNSSEWKLQRADSSNLQQALSKDGYIDQWEIWLPLGSVAASMTIVDSIPWK